MRITLFVFICAALCLPAVAQHSPLIPKPQRVKYGSGSLPVAGLAIRIAGDAADEDRFAASQLAAGILERTGVAVPVTSGTEVHPAILLERAGPVDALPVPGERTGPESRESYRLTVGAGAAVLRARTSAGLYYATVTLVQLLEGAGGSATFPAVEIEDWPAFPYRGTMIDMSEGPLATEAEVFRQLDFLSRWKGNQYYFYNEDSIELSGFPLLNPQARFSKDRVGRFVAYARQRHIDLVPCLELYGHQHDLFRIEEYSTLADFPHGGEFDPANAHAQALLAEWSKQYLDLFPSSFVNIGFDETWEIARAARVKGSGYTPARLFLHQLTTVAQRFLDRNKIVLAWGDMMVKFPDIAAQLPANLIAVPWWYEPDPDPHYTKWLLPLTSHHAPMFVASGVHMWSEMTPDFEKTFRNIDTFFNSGREAGALGVINTVWTDNQEALRRMAWPGIAYGAAAAWQSQAMIETAFFSEFAQALYLPSVSGDVTQGLKELSVAQALAQKIWGAENMDAQWSSPFSPKALEALRGHRDDLRQLRLHAEESQVHFMKAAEGGPRASCIDTYLFGSRLLDYAGMRGLYAIELADLWLRERKAQGKDAETWELLAMGFSRTHGRAGDLMDALSLLIPEYRRNWQAEYTDYRMATATLRWDMEYRFWWQAQTAFDEFHESYHPGDELPDLGRLVGGYKGFTN